MPATQFFRLPLRGYCPLRMQVHLFIDKSLSRLKGSDRSLPQILRLRQMLKRGLGVHHAGASTLTFCVTNCGPVRQPWLCHLTRPSFAVAWNRLAVAWRTL
jgi:hypothetical protein